MFLCETGFFIWISQIEKKVHIRFHKIVLQISSWQKKWRISAILYRTAFVFRLLQGYLLSCIPSENKETSYKIGI